MPTVTRQVLNGTYQTNEGRGKHGSLYKVLGVTPQTSDDDVKRAYRELARKYHPDNYVNNPLADLAETRMKERSTKRTT